MVGILPKFAAIVLARLEPFGMTMMLGRQLGLA